MDTVAINSGKLLFKKTALNTYRIVVFLIPITGFLALASFILLSKLKHEIPTLGFVLIGISILLLIVMFAGKFKYIECYEQKIIIKNYGKIDKVDFSDISAVRYLAASHYTNGIYQGTRCILEVLPRFGRTAKIVIIGSHKDSTDIWYVAQFICRTNPDIELIPV